MLTRLAAKPGVGAGQRGSRCGFVGTRQDLVPLSAAALCSVLHAECCPEVTASRYFVGVRWPGNGPDLDREVVSRRRFGP